MKYYFSNNVIIFASLYITLIEQLNSIIKFRKTNFLIKYYYKLFRLYIKFDLEFSDSFFSAQKSCELS